MVLFKSLPKNVDLYKLAPLQMVLEAYEINFQTFDSYITCLTRQRSLDAHPFPDRDHLQSLGVVVTKSDNEEGSELEEE